MRRRVRSYRRRALLPDFQVSGVFVHMNVIINAVIKWIWEHKLASLLIVLALIAVIYHFGVKNALKNDMEREKEARSTEHQERIEESKTAVNQSANLAKEAKANTKAVENANFSNTNLEKANRLRCKAFPERCR